MILQNDTKYACGTLLFQKDTYYQFNKQQIINYTRK